MMYLILLLSLGLAVIAAPSEDRIIAKWDDGGPRYQNMTRADGCELVDLWLKQSDLDSSALYNPDVDNSYHLYTRENTSKSEVIPMMAADVLKASHYNPQKKTVVLIHGWDNKLNSNFNVLLRNAYLTAEDVNLIVVDWSIGAAGFYIVAMNNVPTSGEHVAKFIKWLIEASDGDINKFHIIGHSLGAHQAGIVGRQLDKKIPYITGLDPAMPGWITHSDAFTSDVAIYTEVIHTDVGISGILSTVGDVDFYPNGGRNAPGCDNNSCNHHRAVMYMAESLVTGGFTGRKCSSFISALTEHCEEDGILKLGGSTPKTGSTGVYYLKTNAESPFSQD